MGGDTGSGIVCSFSLWISFIWASHFGIYLRYLSLIYLAQQSIPLERGFLHQVTVSCWVQFSPRGLISSGMQLSSLLGLGHAIRRLRRCNMLRVRTRAPVEQKRFLFVREAQIY